MTAVLTEYIILFLLKQSKKACHYPMVRLRSDQERTLEELSYLTSLLKENGISLSLVLDPFSLSPSHPAFRFEKNRDRPWQFDRGLGWRKFAS